MTRHRWNIKLNIFPTTNDGISTTSSQTRFEIFFNKFIKLYLSFYHILACWILCLGVLLGEGCFGRVVLGEAVGVKDSEETVKTVAVKMIKSITNVAALEALVSELKILIYLGSHLNVVNLLGACTKKVHRGLSDDILKKWLLFPLLKFIIEY